MEKKKIIRARARKNVGRHYWMFLVACLFAAVLGTEFSSSMSFVNSYSEEAITAQNGDVEAYAGIVTSSNGIVNAINQVAGKNEMFGTSRGVFAQAVNALTSGSIVTTVVSGVNSIFKSDKAGIIVAIVFSILFSLFIWVFIKNIYKVIMRRIFLEGRVYDKIPVSRYMYLLRVKKWTKASVTMLFEYVLYMLWSLTIVGAVIKRYSYYMVPYIVAENPDINPIEAITLSRRMMNGHKWDCFVMELTFLGWNILKHVTLGIAGIFYVNEYEAAAFAEYYVELRALCKKSDMDGMNLLNDTYLYKKADPMSIEVAYEGIVALEKEINASEFTPKKGLRHFISENFGIVLFNHKDEDRYEELQTKKLKYKNHKAVLDGMCYPGKLFPIPEVSKRKETEVFQYLRHYSVPSLVMLFFTFCLIGWLWEVNLHLVTAGEFVNRGVLHGPWLPIYGTGGLLILVLLNRFRKKPALEFGLAVLLCGTVEYFTSYFLEVMHGGVRWWDYTGYFLNLNGRICAEGLLVFGLGGLTIVYFVAPHLDNMYRKIKPQIAIPLCVILLTVFAFDQVYSSKNPNTGKGVTSISQEIENSVAIYKTL